jgi:hypothetical protein
MMNDDKTTTTELLHNFLAGARREGSRPIGEHWRSKRRDPAMAKSRRPHWTSHPRA